MDFEQCTGSSDDNGPKLEEMYENLASITKQLAIIQGFIESKYGHEFTSFCQFSETSSVDPAYTSVVDTASIQEDAEEYDKMPNLVSQESPSRTLGFVTVPLRQTSGGASSSKFQSQSPVQTSSAATGGLSKRERNNAIKEENELETDNGNDDIMYPLHNLSDLLDGAGEVDTNETPEFLELELDPSTLLRGEPPALQPMFASNANHLQIQQQQHCLNNNSNSSGHSSTKRSSSRLSSSSFHRYDIDTPRSTPNVTVTRRASVGSSENNLSHKKFDCHICGIKFEFAETLKSHLESHAGARNVRSNSEDQSSTGNNHNAIPLPRLMPRPLIPISGSVTMDDNEDAAIAVKIPKSNKKRSSQNSTSSAISQTSSTKSIAALKRRKRYNQSRPCALRCPECNLPIRDKSRLIEHLRGHTGERPFECTVCEKAYTRRDVLKTHMLKMHGIAPDFPAS